MKMSLCNAFRFFAVSAIIVLPIVGSPVPGPVNRRKNIITRDLNQDLVHQGSITVELKNDPKRQNDINSLTSNNEKDAYTTTLDSGITKKNTSKGINSTISTDKSISLNVTKYLETSSDVPTESIAEITSSTLKKYLNENFVLPQSEKAHNESKYENENTSALNMLQTTEPSQNETSSFLNNSTNISRNQTEKTIAIETSTIITSSANENSFKSNRSMQLENKTSMSVTTADTIKTNIRKNSSEPIEMSSSISSVTAPTGKKYIVIERKRVIATTDEPLTIDTTTGSIEMNLTTLAAKPASEIHTTEIMVQSESIQGPTSLHDAITSDIPSLERLKTDLLSHPKFTTTSDTESTTRFLPTEENKTKIDLTTPVMSTSEFSSQFPNTVSSKRAGYLDLSPKVIDTITEVLDILKLNGTEALQGPFDAETPDAQDETLEDKIENKVESQGQLAEDAIKEELLKEETLNDIEENAKRHQDEEQVIKTVKVESNVTNYNETTFPAFNAAPDDNLSVKPITSDKLKNTVLYPLNPNYKPLKKIEVQPAKPFVRDPDDNSWRNESLSSLGIVFKPKNSSKPFTQVLKNKTETEWNNLPEKDRKSEVPDLRVRLEQIAQKRKSKKKKIDSFGNVFYTDYEENSSSSEENMSTTQAEDTSVGTVPTTDISSTTDTTIVSPIASTSLSSISQNINSVPALTTPVSPTLDKETTNTLKNNPNKLTTIKPSKMFNLFDYYESNDDDDIADYVHMAKIDLKKYTVPLQTTYTPFTSPPLTILYTNPATHYTSERKGTIQYFPPRTTKRPRKNKQKSNVQNKINSLTESPKNVIPIYHKLPTTRYNGAMYYTNSPDMTGLKDENVQEPKTFDRNLYLTTPPLTTLPDENFGVIGNDGEYNKANYVLKQYKDFMNEGVQVNDPHKNGDLMSYTPHPQRVMVSDFIKSTTVKDDMKMNEYYDYETQFRKDVFERFVANFNENTKRFKSDFPLLYNNSVVHADSNYNDKDVALSRAYFRRPFGNQGDYKPIGVQEPYDPNCDNVTVELSPAYELHYYVPEQEEKQEVEAKPVTLPMRYGL